MYLLCVYHNDVCVLEWVCVYRLIYIYIYAEIEYKQSDVTLCRKPTNFSLFWLAEEKIEIFIHANTIFFIADIFLILECVMCYKLRCIMFTYSIKTHMLLG